MVLKFPEEWMLTVWPEASNNSKNTSFFNLCQFILNMIDVQTWVRNHELMEWSWEGTKKNE